MSAENKQKKKFEDFYVFKCKCGRIIATDYPFIGCSVCGIYSASSEDEHQQGKTMECLGGGTYGYIIGLKNQYPNLEIWQMGDSPEIEYDDENDYDPADDYLFHCDDDCDNCPIMEECCYEQGKDE